MQLSQHEKGSDEIQQRIFSLDMRELEIQLFKEKQLNKESPNGSAFNGNSLKSNTSFCEILSYLSEYLGPFRDIALSEQTSSRRQAIPRFLSLI